MKITLSIILIVLLLHSGLMSQSSSSQLDSLIEQAEIAGQDNPAEAISQLAYVLKQAIESKDILAQSKVYSSLGDLNINIKRYDLALNHLEHALALRQTLEPNDIRLYPKIIECRMRLGQYDQAISETRQFCQLHQDHTRLCEDQLIDLYLLNKDNDLAKELIVQLLDTYTGNKDTLGIARIQAYNSKYFSVTNNIIDAESNLKQSMLNFSNVKVIAPEDQNTLNSASNAIYKNYSLIDSTQQELDFRLFNAQQQEKIGISPSYQIQNKLDIAEIYKKKGELNKAERTINSIKVDELNSKDINYDVASVYKKQSEITHAKGNYKSALATYEKYVTEKNRQIDKKEENLESIKSLIEQQANLALIEKDIALEKSQKIVYSERIKGKNTLIYFLSFLFIGSLISMFVIYKNIKARRRSNKLLMLKSLRTQMNPHFIFNSLNSINSYIADQDERSANRYLTHFSSLMRSVLDLSKEDMITLKEEMDMINVYLSLEHMRFNDQFDYAIQIDPDIPLEKINIPPLMIQPFLENAIWHGLRYRKEKGHLNIHMSQQADAIQILITDNGIGRQKSQALKTANQLKAKSTGIANVGKRIELLEDIYGKKYQVEIHDLNDSETYPGTSVKITIA